MSCFQHQFSSVQDGLYVLAKSHICTRPPQFSDVSPALPLKQFQSCSDPRRPSQDRSLSASSFYSPPPPPPSPPQAIGSVKVLSFIPVGIVSQASQHCSSSGCKPSVVVAICLVHHAVYLLGHLIPCASLGLLFICSLFAASFMNP